MALDYFRSVPARLQQRGLQGLATDQREIEAEEERKRQEEERAKQLEQIKAQYDQATAQATQQAQGLTLRDSILGQARERFEELTGGVGQAASGLGTAVRGGLDQAGQAASDLGEARDEFVQQPARAVAPAPVVSAIDQAGESLGQTGAAVGNAIGQYGDWREDVQAQPRTDRGASAVGDIVAGRRPVESVADFAGIERAGRERLGLGAPAGATEEEAAKYAPQPEGPLWDVGRAAAQQPALGGVSLADVVTGMPRAGRQIAESIDTARGGKEALADEDKTLAERATGAAGLGLGVLGATAGAAGTLYGGPIGARAEEAARGMGREVARGAREVAEAGAEFVAPMGGLAEVARLRAARGPLGAVGRAAEALQARPGMRLGAETGEALTRLEGRLPEAMEAAGALRSAASQVGLPAGTLVGGYKGEEAARQRAEAEGREATPGERLAGVASGAIRGADVGTMPGDVADLGVGTARALRGTARAGLGVTGNLTPDMSVAEGLRGAAGTAGAQARAATRAIGEGPLGQAAGRLAREERGELGRAAPEPAQPAQPAADPAALQAELKEVNQTRAQAAQALGKARLKVGPPDKPPAGLTPETQGIWDAYASSARRAQQIQTEISRAKQGAAQAVETQLGEPTGAPPPNVPRQGRGSFQEPGITYGRGQQGMTWAPQGDLLNGQQAPFFSALQRAVQQLPAGKLAPGQLARQLLAQPDVKKEQLAWSGVEDYLTEKLRANGGRGEAVTREELATWLQEHDVRVYEVQKGESTPVDATERARLDSERPVLQQRAQDAQDELGYVEQQAEGEAFQILGGIQDRMGQTPEGQRALEQSSDQSSLAAQVMFGYSNLPKDVPFFQALEAETRGPGGEGWMEPVLAAATPEERAQLEAIRRQWQDADQAQRDADDALETNERALEAAKGQTLPGGPTKWVDYADGGLNLPGIEEPGANPREFLLTLGPRSDMPSFTESHWDEPNVIAHIRMSSRVTPDGKRVLMIEELQSDWHQKGRAVVKDEQGRPVIDPATGKPKRRGYYPGRRSVEEMRASPEYAERARLTQAVAAAAAAREAFHASGRMDDARRALRLIQAAGYEVAIEKARAAGIPEGYLPTVNESSKLLDRAQGEGFRSNPEPSILVRTTRHPDLEAPRQTEIVAWAPGFSHYGDPEEAGITALIERSQEMNAEEARMWALVRERGEGPGTGQPRYEYTVRPLYNGLIDVAKLVPEVRTAQKTADAVEAEFRALDAAYDEPTRELSNLNYRHGDLGMVDATDRQRAVQARVAELEQDPDIRRSPRYWSDRLGRAIDQAQRADPGLRNQDAYQLPHIQEMMAEAREATGGQQTVEEAQRSLSLVMQRLATSLRREDAQGPYDPFAIDNEIRNHPEVQAAVRAVEEAEQQARNLPTDFEAKYDTLRKLEREQQNLASSLEYGAQKHYPAGRPPAGPFQGEGWQRLALKRMLHLASTEGFDFLGLTPGEVHAFRYDPFGGMGVERLEYHAQTGKLTVDRGDQHDVHEETVKPEELHLYVGNEVADALLSEERVRQGGGVAVITREDWQGGLAVQSEMGIGHRKSYDQILPGMLSDLGRRFGAEVRIAPQTDPKLALLESSLDSGVLLYPDRGPAEMVLDRNESGDRRERPNFQPAHLIEVTPEMRQAMAEPGAQPLFQITPGSAITGAGTTGGALSEGAAALEEDEDEDLTVEERLRRGAAGVGTGAILGTLGTRRGRRALGRGGDVLRLLDQDEAGGLKAGGLKDKTPITGPVTAFGQPARVDPETGQPVTPAPTAGERFREQQGTAQPYSAFEPGSPEARVTDVVDATAQEATEAGVDLPKVREAEAAYAQNPDTPEAVAALEEAVDGYYPSPQQLGGLPGAPAPRHKFGGARPITMLLRMMEAGKEGLRWYEDMAGNLRRHAQPADASVIRTDLWKESLALFGRTGQRTTPEMNHELTFAAMLARDDLMKAGRWPLTSDKAGAQILNRAMRPYVNLLSGEGQGVDGAAVRAEVQRRKDAQGNPWDEPKAPDDRATKPVDDDDAVGDDGSAEISETGADGMPNVRTTDLVLQGILEMWNDGETSIDKNLKLASYTVVLRDPATGRVTLVSVPDVWMFKAFGYEHPDKAASDPEASRYVMAVIKRLADERGLAPAQVQAAIWTGARKLAERDPELMAEMAFRFETEARDKQVSKAKKQATALREGEPPPPVGKAPKGMGGVPEPQRPKVPPLAPPPPKENVKEYAAWERAQEARKKAVVEPTRALFGDLTAEPPKDRARAAVRAWFEKMTPAQRRASQATAHLPRAGEEAAVPPGEGGVPDWTRRPEEAPGPPKPGIAVAEGLLRRREATEYGAVRRARTAQGESAARAAVTEAEARVAASEDAVAAAQDRVEAVARKTDERPPAKGDAEGRAAWDAARQAEKDARAAEKQARADRTEAKAALKAAQKASGESPEAVAAREAEKTYAGTRKAIVKEVGGTKRVVDKATGEETAVPIPGRLAVAKRRIAEAKVKPIERKPASSIWDTAKRWASNGYGDEVPDLRTPEGLAEFQGKIGTPAAVERANEALIGYFQERAADMEAPPEVMDVAHRTQEPEGYPYEQTARTAEAGAMRAERQGRRVNISSPFHAGEGFTKAAGITAPGGVDGWSPEQRVQQTLDWLTKVWGYDPETRQLTKLPGIRHVVYHDQMGSWEGKDDAGLPTVQTEHNVRIIFPTATDQQLRQLGALFGKAGFQDAAGLYRARVTPPEAEVAAQALTPGAPVNNVALIRHPEGRPWDRAEIEAVFGKILPGFELGPQGQLYVANYEPWEGTWKSPQEFNTHVLKLLTDAGRTDAHVLVYFESADIGTIEAKNYDRELAGQAPGGVDAGGVRGLHGGAAGPAGPTLTPTGGVDDLLRQSVEYHRAQGWDIPDDWESRARAFWDAQDAESGGAPGDLGEPGGAPGLTKLGAFGGIGIGGLGAMDGLGARLPDSLEAGLAGAGGVTGAASEAGREEEGEDERARLQRVLGSGAGAGLLMGAVGTRRGRGAVSNLVRNLPEVGGRLAREEAGSLSLGPTAPTALPTTPGRPQRTPDRAKPQPLGPGGLTGPGSPARPLGPPSPPSPTSPTPEAPGAPEAPAKPGRFAPVRDLNTGFNSVVRASALSSPLTLGRNIVQGAVGAAEQPLERFIAAGLDDLIAKVRTDTSARAGEKVTVQEAGAMAKASLGGLGKAMRGGIDAVTGKSEQADLGKTQGFSRMETGAGKKFEKVTDLAFSPTKFINGFFNALSEHVETAGLSARGVAGEALKERATGAATYRSLQSEMDAIGKAMSKVAEAPLVGPALMPFFKTPYNAVKYGLERMPVTSWAITARKFADKEASTAEVAEQAARAVYGTALWAGFLGLAVATDRITGAEPANQTEREEWQAEGKQAYSVRVGDRWVSLALFPALHDTLVAAAATGDVLRQVQHPEEQDDDAVLGSVFTNLLTIGREAVQRPVFGGLTDLLDAMDDPERNGPRLFESLTGNVASALVAPAAGRYVADVLDPYERATSGVQERLMRGQPGQREQLPKARTHVGDVRDRDTGVPGMIGRALNPLKTTRARPGREFYEYTQAESAKEDRLIRQAKAKVDRYRRAPDEYPEPTNAEYDWADLAKRPTDRDPEFDKYRAEEDKERRLQQQGAEARRRKSPLPGPLKGLLGGYGRGGGGLPSRVTGPAALLLRGGR